MWIVSGAYGDLPTHNCRDCRARVVASRVFRRETRPLLRRQRGSAFSCTLAYNLGSFMRTLATPKTAEPWPLTSLQERRAAWNSLWFIRRNQADPSRTSGHAIFIPVTNAIEALNSKLHRTVKAKGHFP
jgi:hypothetical protein